MIFNISADSLSGEEAFWVWIFPLGLSEEAVAPETRDIWDHKPNTTTLAQGAARIPGTVCVQDPSLKHWYPTVSVALES